MTDHLVAYEYGTGAIWGYVTAESADQITDAVPELDVYDGAPPFLTDDDLDAMREEAIPLADGHIVDRLIAVSQ